MGNRLAAWINTLPTGHEHRGCLQQIVDVYGTLDSFESILADLMTCPPGSKAAASGVARPYLLSNLEEAIRDHFDAIRSTSAPLYDGLARILRPGDLVITFNYDLGVSARCVRLDCGISGRVTAFQLGTGSSRRPWKY